MQLFALRASSRRTRPPLARAMSSADGAAALQAPVLEVVILRIRGITDGYVELPSSPYSRRPAADTLATWAAICDLVDRVRQSREHAPPSVQARKFVANVVNRVTWLLLRAFAPASQYRNLTPQRLQSEYRLPPDMGDVARRAVRTTWIRRCILALRILYSYGADVRDYSNISADAIRPALQGLLDDLTRHARHVLPRHPPPALDIRPFEEVSAAMVASGPFAL